MKLKKLLICTTLIILFGINAFSQSDSEREKIKKSYAENQLQIKSLKKIQEDKHKASEKKVEEYLKKNPTKKRSFEKNGSSYYLKYIDKEGNPIYINTKNRESGALIKADQMYAGGSVGISVTGVGMIAGVWDGGQVRATHELLTGKVTMQPNQNLPGTTSSYKGSNHQTHVTGTMVGRELASQPSARGIAHGATAQNYDWTDDLTEMIAFANSGLLISNHSYGLANDNTIPEWTFGAYNEEARSWDALIKTHPNYLLFVAAGNEQQSNGNTAKAGYDLMTGGCSSKNVMTIGAVNGDKTMSDYSNWGPTDDGRVKPEIVTRGTGINSSVYAIPNTSTPSDVSYSGNGSNSSGTSYASPAAAASGLLLQQYYNQLHGAYMKASTLKAIMLGTAEDLGQAGPDNKFGWGLLDLEKAANAIKNRSSSVSPAAATFTDASSKGAYIEEITINPNANSTDEIIRNIYGAGGTDTLIISIAWTDDEGPEQVVGDGVDPTLSRLIYNFDMLVTSTSANIRPFKPSNMASRTANATLETSWFDGNGNNYKQIKITNPVANEVYSIHIRKKTGSPALARIISLVVTGTKVGGLTALANQSFCTSATVANLTANGSGIKWYTTASGGVALASTTGLTTATDYYASETVNSVESLNRVKVTVTLNATALTPTFTQVSGICSGATLSALPTVSSNSVTGTWLPALSNTSTTSYTFTPSLGQCANTASMIITVTSLTTLEALPPVVTICSGITVPFSLTASGVNLTYKWSTGETGTTISVSTSGTYFVTVTGTCGTKVSNAVELSVNNCTPTPNPSSLSYFNGSKLVIYPNPNNGTFLIDFQNAENLEILVYSITSLEGRELAKGTLVKGENTIETTLSKGIYFLKAGNSMSKLVIN